MVTLDARAGKWLMLALTLSLGANLFLGGLFAGTYAGGRGGPAGPAIVTGDAEPAAGRAAGGPIARMVLALSPEHRPIFEQAMARHRRDLQGANVSVRLARLRLRDALLAEPYDQAAFAEAGRELARRNAEQAAVATEAVIDAVARLPAEARRQLARMPAVENLSPSGPRPGGGPRPGASPPPREGRQP